MQRPKQFKPTSTSGTDRKFNGRAHIDAMYDDAWNKYRVRFLKENPRCYCCGRVATVVDHLKVHRGDERLFKQLDNHVPNCEKCHNSITALFDRHPVQKLNDKIKWLQWSRAKNELNFKVKVLPRYES